ncbi:MAG: SPOR domain-containing protein, partial [Paracoccaceae bacterium]
APVVTEEVGAAVLDPATLIEPSTESSTDAAVAQALADVLAEGVAPLTPLTEEAPLAAADAPVVLGEATETAPTRSPRPQARPGARDAAASATLPTDVQSVVAVVPSEIDATTLEIGTRLVQLGAFDDEPGARAEWLRLQAQFGDLMTEKSLVIQAAQSGGRTFYRLRAHGFASEDDARRFCAALVAENAPCIPAAHR